jgi:hypothetical protein
MSDDRGLRHYLAQYDAPCPGCGYNLRGLTGDTCPECGDALRLGVVGSGRSGRARWKVWAAHPVALVLAATVGLGLLLGREAAGTMLLACAGAMLAWFGFRAALWCWSAVALYLLGPVPYTGRQLRLNTEGGLVVCVAVAIVVLIMLRLA